MYAHQRPVSQRFGHMICKKTASIDGARRFEPLQCNERRRQRARVLFLLEESRRFLAQYREKAFGCLRQ
jgi:hypothetical protein